MLQTAQYLAINLESPLYLTTQLLLVLHSNSYVVPYHDTNYSALCFNKYETILNTFIVLGPCI